MTHDELKQAVESAGSQAALARAIGVSKQALFQYMTGERPVPSHRESLIRMTHPVAPTTGNNEEGE